MGNPFLLSLPLLSICCRGKGIHSEALQPRDLRVKEQLLGCVQPPPPKFETDGNSIRLYQNSAPPALTAKLLPASITAVHTSLNENCIHNGKITPLGQCVPLFGSEPHTVGQETHCLLGHLFLACLMKGGLTCLSVKV